MNLKLSFKHKQNNELIKILHGTIFRNISIIITNTISWVYFKNYTILIRKLQNLL